MGPLVLPVPLFFSNTLITGNATGLSAVGGGNLVSLQKQQL